MQNKDRRLSRENLKNLNRNIEETRRKREDVKKEVIIRTDLLATQVDDMSSIEDLKKENDETEEEIENELIRTGVIDKPEEREGEQEYQSLLDLFQPRVIESDTFVVEINEGKDLTSLHKYNENQRRYYNKDREVRSRGKIQNSAKMNVNFKDRKQKNIKKDEIRDNKPRKPIEVKELGTELEVRTNFQSRELKEEIEKKEVPLDRKKTFGKMFDRLKK